LKKRSKKRWLRKYDGKKHGWLRTTMDSVAILIVVSLIFSLLVGVSRVSGRSMEPTLHNGQVVFFLRLPGKLRQGDVVFARMPSGSNYVKRVVAVEGDVVELVGDRLYINGQPEVTAFDVPVHAQEGIVEYPYRVEPGKVFLVGDNRPESEDSRTFGALPLSSIKGKLLGVD